MPAIESFTQELIVARRACSLFLGVEAGALALKQRARLTSELMSVNNIRDAWSQPNPNEGFDTVFVYGRQFFGLHNGARRFVDFVERAAAPLGDIAVVAYLDDQIAPHCLFRHHRANKTQA